MAMTALYAVDWDYLTRFSTPDERMEALFGEGRPAEVLEEESEIVGHSHANASWHIEVWDALEKIGREDDNPSAPLIQTAFAPILVGSLNDLDVADQMAVLSPTTVCGMASAICTLDLPALAGRLKVEQRYPSEALDFLNDKAAVILHAKGKGCGLVYFVG